LRIEWPNWRMSGEMVAKSSGSIGRPLAAMAFAASVMSTPQGPYATSESIGDVAELAERLGWTSARVMRLSHGWFVAEHLAAQRQAPLLP
jgi:hypothetical protein